MEKAFYKNQILIIVDKLNKILFNKLENFDINEIDCFICQNDPRITYPDIKEKYSSSNKCDSIYANEHYGFRCKDCGLSETSCMCLSCFDLNLHKGHDYSLYHANVGGCCDCGDSCWSSKTWCEKHRIKRDPIPFEEKYLLYI